MRKPEIFRYTYSYDFYGYTIKYNGIIIDGLCTIPEFMENSLDPYWIEYHNIQAQNKLKQILIQKKLWQNRKVAPTTLKK